MSTKQRGSSPVTIKANYPHMSHDVTPFKGRSEIAVRPTRFFKRFARSGQVAEIRERTVPDFEGVELVVFVDGSLLESQMFHGRRLNEYASALSKRAKQFTDDGWVEQRITTEPNLGASTTTIPR